VSSAAQEAAAALAPAMAATLVEKMPLEGDDQLAADVAATQGVEATPPVSSSQPQTAPAAAQATETETPEADELSLDPDIPDDLQALLDEPDFDEEADAEVTAEAEEWDPDATDPETAKRLRALEKRNKWLEDRVVASDSKKWLAENTKAYPLLARYAPDELQAIKATSRRGFAREAAALNARYAKALTPALQDIAEAKKQLNGEVAKEVRGEYKQAWGEITTGPGNVPMEAAAQRKELEAARETGNLSKIVGAMMRAAGVNNKQGGA
jgi:hypothetical protein